MALILKDRVKETSTSTGTGDFVLAGAANGFQSFTDALADGDTTYYAIEDGTDWETGLGTWAEATSTLTRTTVYESSNSGNAVDWGEGSKNVFITQPASRAATLAVYPTIGDLPLSGNVQAGDQAFVSATNRLYLFNGSGWYNIALLNLTPTIDTQPDANYGLDPSGASLTITLTATDPEGFPLTWSANTTGMTGLATLSQNDNAFTFTPSNAPENQGQSFTATFSVTDGINTAISNQATFTIGVSQLTEPSIGTLTITAANGTAVFIAGLSELWKDVTLSIGTSSTNGADNSTFIDRSTNAHTVGLVGTPVQTQFHPYLENWSAYLSTEASALSWENDDLRIGSGDFTLEGWFWVNEDTRATGTYHALFDTSKDTTYGFSNNVFSAHIGIWMTNTDTLRVYSSGSAAITTTATMNLNEWTHLALVRSGTTVTFYINGVSAGTFNSSVNYSLNALTFGAGPYWGATYQAGPMYVGDFRIEVGSAVYTADFTPTYEKMQSTANTKFIRAGKNNLNAVIGGVDTAPIYFTDASSETFNPFGQESEYAAGENKGSIEFDNGNQVQPTGSIIDVGTGDFTIEFWSYGIPTSDAILDTRVGTGNTTGALIQARDTGYRYQSTSSLTSASGLAPFVKQWLHFAAVRNSGTVTIYHNGVGEQVTTGDTTDFTATTVTVGANSGLGYDVAEGYCSDLRITKSAVYTADFTPPTAPVGNTSASLYLPFDNAGIFDKTGNHTLTLAGDTSTSTTQTKFADTAIYFDGIGDYVQIPDDDNFELTGDFTIEFWAYSTGTQTSGYQSIIGGNGSGSNGWNIYATQGTGVIYFFHGSFLIASSANDFPANQWNHVAVARSGSDIKMFVGGTQVGSTASSSATLNQNTGNFGTRIGYDINANGYYSGYLENLQILKGIAKYTANFTVPDQEQGRNNQAES